MSRSTISAFQVFELFPDPHAARKYLEHRRRAGQEFGTLELAKDECRDQRFAEWLNYILRDIRHACRSMWKSPGFAAAVIATLALRRRNSALPFSVLPSIRVSGGSQAAISWQNSCMC